LTGLFNRRYLDEVLAKEWYRAQRYERPLTIAIADLDYFKRINDRHSHQMGDTILQTVAEIMLERVRQTDFVARYGGEEFVIVFPEADLAEAHQCCEDIRESVATYDWASLGCDSSVTISIGLSDRADSAESLMAAADRQLYRAKARGRDRVAVHAY
jgi:diguanylate cyclase (GGDEF)-like protein